MRRRARTDANHREITRAFREAGFGVRNIKWPCDLIVCDPIGRLVWCIDIKRPGKRAELTDSQRALIDERWPFDVVETPADVERLRARAAAAGKQGKMTV